MTSVAQIKRAITHFWSCYRWSQRQVAQRPENRFERGMLRFNQQAVKCLIADCRKASPRKAVEHDLHAI